MAGSPSMRRRRLAAELRRLRAEAGLSIEDTAGKLKWPGSKISRIENRQVGVSPRDLRKLLDLYHVADHDYREELPGTAARLTDLMLNATAGNWGRVRTRAEVDRFFGELEVIPPGLVEITTWHPDDTGTEEQTFDWIEYGGVARK